MGRLGRGQLTITACAGRRDHSGSAGRASSLDPGLAPADVPQRTLACARTVRTVLLTGLPVAVKRDEGGGETGWERTARAAVDHSRAPSDELALAAALTRFPPPPAGDSARQPSLEIACAADSLCPHASAPCPQAAHASATCSLTRNLARLRILVRTSSAHDREQAARARAPLPLTAALASPSCRRTAAAGASVGRQQAERTSHPSLSVRVRAREKVDRL